MKKLSLSILIGLMLFAFVACSPDSSNSTEDSLLLGEVIPPSESEMVSVTESQTQIISNFFKYMENENNETTKFIRETEVEIDYGDDGTLTAKKNQKYEEDMKVGDVAGEITANGKIKVGENVYSATDLVMEGTITSKGFFDSYNYTIKSGTFMKNDVEMSASDIFAFLFSDEFIDDPLCKSFTEKETKTIATRLVGDDKKSVVGTGTSVEVDKRTKDKTSTVVVFDYTFNGLHIQGKMTETNVSMGIDYFALDGRFFDKDSRDKLMKMMMGK